MLPTFIGPGSFPPPPLAPVAPTRAEQGAHSLVDESVPSGARAGVPNRVDPPRVLPGAAQVSEDTPRRDRLPPDPDGPAGPPPTFEATPLEREREKLMARPALIPRPETPSVTEDKAEAAFPAGGAAAATVKVEAEVAEIRRIAVPTADRNMDIIR